MTEQWSNANLCVGGKPVDVTLSSSATQPDAVAACATRCLQLHELATPGPWREMIASGASGLCSWVHADACPLKDNAVCCISDRDGYGNQTAEYNDAALIAYYRTAAPVLALALLRLRALVAEKNPELLSSGVRHDDG